jgi:hypothetical protein
MVDGQDIPSSLWLSCWRHFGMRRAFFFSLWMTGEQWMHRVTAQCFDFWGKPGYSLDCKLWAVIVSWETNRLCFGGTGISVWLVYAEVESLSFIPCSLEHLCCSNNCESNTCFNVTYCKHLLENSVSIKLFLWDAVTRYVTIRCFFTM